MVSETEPPLKIRIVGIARIAYFPAISLLLSTLTLQIFTASPSSSASSSRMGAIALQGPHHGAQKSTTTGVDPPLIAASKLLLSSSVILSDMILYLLVYDRKGSTSLRRSAVKAMATAAAMASMTTMATLTLGAA